MCPSHKNIDTSDNEQYSIEGYNQQYIYLNPITSGEELPKSDSEAMVLAHDHKKINLQTFYLDVENPAPEGSRWQIMQKQ